MTAHRVQYTGGYNNPLEQLLPGGTSLTFRTGCKCAYLASEIWGTGEIVCGLKYRGPKHTNCGSKSKARRDYLWSVNYHVLRKRTADYLGKNVGRFFGGLRRFLDMSISFQKSRRSSTGNCHCSLKNFYDIELRASTTFHVWLLVGRGTPKIFWYILEKFYHWPLF